MKYLYYPGCSLKSSGKSYEESLLAVYKKLNINLEELEDWNCCGATNYMSINENNAISITARNLAIAEKQGGPDSTIMAPCAACYMGLLKTKQYIQTEPKIKESVTKNLKEAGLEFENKSVVRHPLDILINDIGTNLIGNSVEKPLKGYKVASYYGCQLLRPYSTFDDFRNPTSMETIVKTLGAEPVDWSLKTRCCGGSMTSTMSDIGLRLNFLLMKEAKFRGADVIITACPLCQFNLECFQNKISKKFGEDVHIPVMYFTQLMGIAFGINEKELGLQRSLSPELTLTK
jgi:heterodisulfide reductase subunit B2